MRTNIRENDEFEPLIQKIKNYIGLNEEIHIIYQNVLDFKSLLIYLSLGIILTFIIGLFFFLNLILFILVSLGLSLPLAYSFSRVWSLISANSSYIVTNFKIIILKQHKRIILIPFIAIDSIERGIFGRIYNIKIKFNENAQKFLTGKIRSNIPFFISLIPKDNTLFEELKNHYDIYLKGINPMSKDTDNDIKS